ncbi:unnamed protein product, partial [Ranitomeya imitator]
MDPSSAAGSSPASGRQDGFMDAAVGAGTDVSCCAASSSTQAPFSPGSQSLDPSSAVPVPGQGTQVDLTGRQGRPDSGGSFADTASRGRLDASTPAGGPTDPLQPDKNKKEEGKKEDEEKRRWRLIPQMFGNWLQAFVILASVIGEKAPENCSGLFCYLDSISEAHRVYGGQAWLRKNLRSALLHAEVVSEKLRKEVALGRMAGPFESPPFVDLVVSPLEVVPKKEAGKFRLIQHLSYPRVRKFRRMDTSLFRGFTVGELVSPSKKVVGGLLARDVLLLAGRVELWLRRSKVDQEGPSPLLVWIFGHSYVYWGAQRADVRSEGRQLGFDREEAVIRWLGFWGLVWRRVPKEINDGARLDKAPDILVLHVGGNDLGARPFRELIKYIKQDCLRLWVLYPGLTIVWSKIVPRKRWRNMRSLDKLNKARIKVNRAVSSFVARNGGVAVRHFELEKGEGAFWLADGVHLNAKFHTRKPKPLAVPLSRIPNISVIILYPECQRHYPVSRVVIILYPECQCHYPVPPVSVLRFCTPSVSVIIAYPSVSIIIPNPECQRHYPVPPVSVSLSCTLSVSVIILYPMCQCHYPVPRVSASLSCTPRVSVIILYPKCQRYYPVPECQCHYPVPRVSVSLSCTLSVSVIIPYPSVSITILYPECQRHYPVPRVSVSLPCTPIVSVIILFPEFLVEEYTDPGNIFELKLAGSGKGLDMWFEGDQSKRLPQGSELVGLER